MKKYLAVASLACLVLVITVMISKCGITEMPYVTPEDSVRAAERRAQPSWIENDVMADCAYISAHLAKRGITKDVEQCYDAKIRTVPEKYRTGNRPARGPKRPDCVSTNLPNSLPWEC